MSAASFAMIMNIAVASLFAAAFFAMAQASPAFRKVRLFGLSYVVGAATPASEFLVRYSPWPEVFVAMSFASLSAGFHLMAVGLALYYRLRVPWLLLSSTFAGSLLLRAAIWGGQRDTMPYELLYQMPFAAILGICAALVMRAQGRRRTDNVLALAFGLAAAHFLVKPFVAIALGSGATARDYAASAYASFSQALTGILLMSIGVVLMLVVARDLLKETRGTAETDPLSGVRNRRGFDAYATEALERTRRSGLPASLLMCDIDHFKSINDRFGHHSGDLVIAAFGDLLTRTMPHSAIISRVGGEEFAVLLENANVASARLAAETARAGLAAMSFAAPSGEFGATTSIGVATAQSGERLDALMRRADAALYRAKQGGRDRVALAEGEDNATAIAPNGSSGSGSGPRPRRQRDR